MKAVFLGFVLIAVGAILIASVPTPAPWFIALLIAFVPASGGFLIVFGFLFALMDP